MGAINDESTTLAFDPNQLLEHLFQVVKREPPLRLGTESLCNSGLLVVLSLTPHALCLRNKASLPPCGSRC